MKVFQGMALMAAVVVMTGCGDSPAGPDDDASTAPGIYEIVSMDGRPLPYQNPHFSHLSIIGGWVRLSNPLTERHAGTGKVVFCEREIMPPPHDPWVRTRGPDVRWWTLNDGRIAMRGTYGANPSVDTLHVQGNRATVRTGDISPNYELVKISDDPRSQTPHCGNPD